MQARAIRLAFYVHPVDRTRVFLLVWQILSSQAHCFPVLTCAFRLNCTTVCGLLSLIPLEKSPVPLNASVLWWTTGTGHSVGSAGVSQCSVGKPDVTSLCSLTIRVSVCLPVPHKAQYLRWDWLGPQSTEGRAVSSSVC